MESLTDETRPIAIIGMSGRFPGEASNPNKLWDLCAAGKDAWSPIPEGRFNSEAFYHPDSGRNGSTNARGGFFLKEDQAFFDAPFFGINVAEAAALDPQQRLLLESSYEAFENAGIRIEDIAGENVGVFVGTFCKDWENLTSQDPDAIPMYWITGGGHSMLSNRLSYVYNLCGPSFTVDTACSSSLVALHLACESLKAGECSSAVVAGVNCLLDPDQFVTLSSIGFLSPDGRCYSFDHRANGYGRGEGVGCVILKPLDEALKNGDVIRGVIRNTGINQDGKTPGVTFPSAKAQEALARKVYLKAGLDPLDTTYVETHGTGTQAGDPVEASALFATFGKSRSDPLQIGSVKTNIGHLEGASGVTGLIKTILMLEREQILPNYGFEAPNKRTPLEQWNLQVPTKCSPWVRKNGVLRASVQSFGYAGTNAHAIVEDARGYLKAREFKPNGKLDPVLRSSGNLERRSVVLDDISSEDGSFAGAETPDSSNSHLADRRYAIDIEPEAKASPSTNTEAVKKQLFVISAYDEVAGKDYLNSLHDYLSQEAVERSGPFMTNLAETLSKHRSSLPWKTSIIASSSSQLVSGLQNANFSHSTKPPSIGFVFTGQGAQWHAMARSLLCVQGFRESLNFSNEVLESLDAGWSVMEELYKDENSTKVNEAIMSQPLCTIIQIALVDLLRSWKITPTAVVGHSSGEIAAAYAAGTLDHKHAVTTAYYRGVVVGLKKQQGNLITGAMAALRATQLEVLELLGELRNDKAQIACHNSPRSFTVSGDETAIQELLDLCSSKDIWARKLLVDVAYHSSKMQFISEEYRTRLINTSIPSDLSHQPLCEQFSSVTGRRVQSSEISPDYWVENLTSPVLFSDALLEMCTKSKGRASTRARNISSIDLLIEIGPHGALAAPVREIIQSHPALAKITYISALNRQEDAVESVLKVASRLFERGCFVDVSAINQPAQQEKPKILVDLPTYPWNHSTKHWAEPRVHAEYRLRNEPRHDILGATVKFSNSREPRWRNWLRLSELPWLRDHRVQSLIIFPAAGYISMAIEAARQLAQKLNLPICGYDLRQINLSQALVIPEPSGQVETMLCMKKYAESSRSSSTTWDEFFVYSASDKGEWIEHCRGHISVRQSAQLNVVDGQRQHELTRSDHAHQRLEAESECSRTVQGSGLYAQCTKVGLEYGPSFANLTEARVGRQAGSKTWLGAIGTVIHPDIEKIMPESYHSPCVVHPATLDSFFHVAIAAPNGLKSAAVPTFISSVFVSSNLPSESQHKFSVYGTIDGQRNPNISLAVYDCATTPDLPSVEVHGLQMTSLSGEQGEQGLGGPRKSYYRTKIRPDASLLSPIQFSALCNHLEPTEDESQLEALIDEAVFYMADKAIKQIPKTSASILPPKGEKLYRSLQRIVDHVAGGRLPYATSSWVTKSILGRESVLNKVRSSGDEGSFAVLIGEQFEGLILGTVDPLALTMENDALGRYYANNSRMVRQCECYKFLLAFKFYRDERDQQGAIFVDLLAHKNPHLRVLEIGAGTGGATLPILTVLGGGDDQSPPRFLSYDVTDITTGFFDKVQQKAAGWGDLVSYKKLDIEKNLEDQGFEPEYYDIVIAANVLHATANMSRTLTNVRKLLKPGGTLLLVELIPKMAGVTNIFGIFDGWWMAEEETRKDSPLISEERWDIVLRQAGFSGVDMALPDTPNEMTHQGSTMISRTIAAPYINENDSTSFPPSSYHAKDLVIVETDAAISNSSKISQQITHHEKLKGSVQESVNFCNLHPDAKNYILLELNSSILSGMTEVTLNNLKGLMSNANGLLWVTRGASYQSTKPDLSLVSGFLRTLRAETGRHIVHLDLDPSSDSEGTSANVIVEVYKHCFENGDAESEFVERGGVILIPRHMEDDTFGINVAGRTGSRAPEIGIIPQEGRPLKLQIAQLGLLDSFYFDDDLRLVDELPDGHVEIEVKASALNFRDIMMTMGQIETTDLGHECSGVVSRVASNVRTLKVGDRVMTTGDGMFATFVRVHEIRVFKIPETMTFEAAAAVPVAYGTAYFALKAARLSQEDTVLIHASTGALGQALIMMCQHLGARILATVGTLEKKTFLMTQFSIPEEQIFYSRDSSFREGIMRITEGRGVDVIFNSLSSELQRVTWECIAPFGRFIELGKRDFTVNSRLEQARFSDNVTFVGLDFRHLTMVRPECCQEAFQGYMTLLQQGKLSPPQPISTYGLGEVEKAFRTMQSGRHIGKLVLITKGEESFKVMPRAAARTILHGDATYILIGGMGGIGRALAVRLVESGAKHLVFLSRSGATTKAATELINVLQHAGSVVTVIKCDVGNLSQLETAVEVIAQSSPPIKGMFHLGMVMQSALFENMTLEDWTESLLPKVRGTWNLHKVLPKDLDFFVLISSFVGAIGNASQAAYSAASSFQDAFSTYRNHLGLPATTVDLGLVTEIGYVADRDILESKLKSQGYEDISADECLAIIEEAISQPFQSEHGGNIIAGFGLGRFTGGDIHHVSHQTPQSSHVRRLALSAYSGHALKEESAVSVRVRELLRNATSLAVAEEQVSDAIRLKLSNLLMLSLDDIDSSRPLSYYGLDSLVAVEMRNWIASEIEATVAVLELLGTQSIFELSKSITRQSRIVQKLALATGK